MNRAAAPVSPEEARQALALVEATTRAMRRWTAQGSTPYFLFIWGTVWMLGFGTAHFLGPEHPRMVWVWAGLDGLGVLASFVVGAWLGRRVRSPQGVQVALFWLAWMLYGSLIVTFAQPRSANQTALLIALLAMMGYVTMGLLYRSPWLVGLGLVVTAWMVLGYVAWPAWFNLWMAVLGGGSLLAAGAYMRWMWR